MKKKSSILQKNKRKDYGLICDFGIVVSRKVRKAKKR